jgi:hypothetical protein
MQCSQIQLIIFLIALLQSILLLATINYIDREPLTSSAPYSS